jgi:hypothetical protein
MTPAQVRSLRRMVERVITGKDGAFPNLVAWVDAYADRPREPVPAPVQPDGTAPWPAVVVERVEFSVKREPLHGLAGRLRRLFA